MLYKVLADFVVVIHFGWIVFMLLGFVLTVYGLLCWHGFLDKWLFRTVHMAGILYVALLAVLEEYCPLTILENALLQRHDPDMVYPGSFIVYHIERLVYPNVHPAIVVIPTLFIALFTIVVFIIRPPQKLRWRGRGLREGKG